MYALSFDMDIVDLQEHYGNPYRNAYHLTPLRKI